MTKIKFIFLFLFFSALIQAQSIPQLQRLANQGNADAQFLLAQRLAQGSGVKQDFKQAFHWLKQASGQEHAAAMNYLGLCYCNGIGTEKNLEQAFQLFHESAAKQNSEGQYNLGYCYYYGEGTALDYKQAVYWFERAAQKRHLEAMNKLGECYKNGQGVKQNYTKALHYFQMAANERNIAGQFNIGLLYYFGQGVEQNYATAIEWFTLAGTNNNVRNGHPWAQYYLGLCYKNGQGVKKNYEQAAKNFSASAAQHYDLAQQELGRCYEGGLGVEQNYKTAYAWLLKGNAPEVDLHYKNLSVFTDFFVENSVRKLHAKLESETDSVYQQRLLLLQTDSAVLSELRPQAAEHYLEIKKDYFVYEPLNITSYDTLAKQFAFASPQAGTQLLKIEPELADSFSAQFGRMQQTPIFVLENDEVAIQNFKIYWQTTDSTYHTISEQITPIRNFGK